MADEPTENILEPVAADARFFTALLASDIETLDGLLDADFIMIDVMSGSEIQKSTLLGAIGSGQLEFQSIAPADAHARRYGETAIVIGRTEMSFRFEQTVFNTRSRYTHVYIEERGDWRMVSAQGTPIAVEQDTASDRR